MRTAPPVDRFPWQRIVTALAIAGLIAWGAGFAAGLIVKFVVPRWPW
jgi:hypothetical protein